MRLYLILKEAATKIFILIKHISNIREKAGRHKTLIQNFSYLSALQIFNLILPLITYPYLIRVLGKETYGLVIFAQAIIGYLLIMVSFGFNISATKEVSINREDKEKLSEIISSVIIIKIGLFLIALGILSALIFFIPQVHDYKFLFFLTLWICLYDVIFPIWYFQGIEKMKYITYLTLISRLIFVGLIFVFIHSSQDYLLIPIINGIGALLSGAFSLIIIFGKHRLKFRFPSYEHVKCNLINSTPIFISNLSVQAYLATNKVLVGIFLGLTDVAYYDLGEKILNLFKLPISIVSQVIFPKMSKSYNMLFLKKVIGLTFIVVLTGIITFHFVADNIITFFAGKSMQPAAKVAQILVISLLPLTISNGFGIQTLLSQGYNRQYTNIVLQTTLIYFMLVTSLILIEKLSIYTLSIISILIEIYMLISFYLKCKKLKLT